LAGLGLLAGLGVASCDLVNRGLDKQLLPNPPDPDPESWQPQSKATLMLALKTHDAERHVCASDQEFGAVRCDFRGKKLRFPRPKGRAIDDNKQDVLQPYRTAVGEHPVLIAGVWHTPEVAFRRHREPPRGRKSEELQTFYVECEVEFLGQVEQLEVRYSFGQKWQSEKPSPAGRALWCTVLSSEG